MLQIFFLTIPKKYRVSNDQRHWLFGLIIKSKLKFRLVRHSWTKKSGTISGFGMFAYYYFVMPTLLFKEGLFTHRANPEECLPEANCFGSERAFNFFEANAVDCSISNRSCGPYELLGGSITIGTMLSFPPHTGHS